MLPHRGEMVSVTYTPRLSPPQSSRMCSGPVGQLSDKRSLIPGVHAVEGALVSCKCPLVSTHVYTNKCSKVTTFWHPLVRPVGDGT